MLIKISLLFSMIIFSSCKDNSTETIVYKDPVPVNRWMDREIFFAYSTGGSPQRNNEFQKVKVQEALDEIAMGSTLGQGYFNYTQVDEALLQPVLEPGNSALAYKSFVLIWPDVDFNNFIVNSLGGVVPDQNAAVIINSSFKRKFYMIIKASCFTSSSSCNGISAQGVKALIARQMGFLVGIPPQTPAQCTSDPANVMCPLASNDQWTDSNRIRFMNSFNNSLEAIVNNINYYDEHPVTK